MIRQNLSPACSLTVYRNDSFILAALSGNLRLHNCEEVKQRVINLLTEDVRNFYLHLGQLKELDSVGLGVLVGLHTTARKRKCDFSLLSPTTFQVKLFEATRLNTIFSVISGVEAETLWLRLARDENRIG